MEPAEQHRLQVSQLGRTDRVEGACERAVLVALALALALVVEPVPEIVAAVLAAAGLVVVVVPPGSALGASVASTAVATGDWTAVAAR